MNRLWLSVSSVALCVVQVLTGWNVAFADDHAAGEKLLPKETLAFFTITDVPDLVAKWDKTSIGQMFHDPKLKPFLEELEKKKDEHSKLLEEKIGVSIDELQELPQGELTIAALELPPRTISVVLMFDYGENKETVEKLLKKMDEELEQEAEHSTQDIGDVKVHTYKPKKDDTENPIKSLIYFTDEGYLVFSNELDAIKAVLERWDGDSEDTLAQHEQFKYIQGQCKLESGEPLVKLFLNPIGIIQTGISLAQTALPQVGMAAGFLPLLGFDGLKGFGWNFTFDEGDYEEYSVSYNYADPAKGLLGLFSMPAAQLVPPKWVPANVATYSILNWDFQAAYKSVETLVDSFRGRGATARALDEIAEQPPMIHPKKDFLDHLDGKLLLTMQGDTKEDSDDEASIPMITFAMGVKDAAKMKKTVSAASKAVGPFIETREFNGETIYEIKPPQGNVTISITVAEGYLVISNDTPQVEGLLRGQSSRAASLVDSADFKRHAKSFPAKVSSQTFQRRDVQYKSLYNMFKKSGGEALDIDTSTLPPFEAIAKYLLPTAGYMEPDKKGAKTVGFTLKRAD